MTLRDALATCEPFHEFEDQTGMTLSETELEAYKERADAAGICMAQFFEQAVTRIRRAQEQLETHTRGMLH